MEIYPTPKEEGHYWAQLVYAHNEPDGEDWAGPSWMVVEVYDNNGTGVDKWRVATPGIEPGQLIDGFNWGPRVPEFRGR